MWEAVKLQLSRKICLVGGDLGQRLAAKRGKTTKKHNLGWTYGKNDAFTDQYVLVRGCGLFAKWPLTVNWLETIPNNATPIAHIFFVAFLLLSFLPALHPLLLPGGSPPYEADEALSLSKWLKRQLMTHERVTEGQVIHWKAGRQLSKWTSAEQKLSGAICTYTVPRYWLQGPILVCVTKQQGTWDLLQSGFFLFSIKKSWAVQQWLIGEARFILPNPHKRAIWNVEYG